MSDPVSLSVVVPPVPGEAEGPAMLRPLTEPVSVPSVVPPVPGEAEGPAVLRPLTEPVAPSAAEVRQVRTTREHVRGQTVRSGQRSDISVTFRDEG